MQSSRPIINSTLDNTIRKLSRVEIVKSSTQFHYTKNRTKSTVKPYIGTLLYRYKRNEYRYFTRLVKCKTSSSSAIQCEELVVTQIGYKNRGKNKGLVGVIYCRLVDRISNGCIYYDSNSHFYIFKLNNHGNWFNHEDLEDHIYFWDSRPDFSFTTSPDTDFYLSHYSTLDDLSTISTSNMASPPINIDRLQNRSDSTVLSPIIPGSSSSWEPAIHSPSLSPNIEVRDRSLSQPPLMVEDLSELSLMTSDGRTDNNVIEQNSIARI